MRKAFDYDNARNDVFYEFVSYPRMLPFLRNCFLHAHSQRDEAPELRCGRINVMITLTLQEASSKFDTKKKLHRKANQCFIKILINY